MSDTKSTYQEEIELVKGFFGGAAQEGDLRGDNPQKKVELSVVRGHIARLTQEVAELQDVEQGLVVVLLPDDERVRLAQIARDFRDGTMPPLDDDVPLTPCPDWCEAEGHGETGTGKYHEGALTKVEGINFVANSNEETHKWADCYVALADDDGRPLLNIYGDTYMDAAGARAFAAGLLRAADLYERLSGAK